MKMNKTFLKWSPALPIHKPDNLISSHAKASFTPSYENDSKENMNFLMSNEYMRIWFNERAAYEKDIYTREQIIKEESKIKRRIIQRMMTYRTPTKNHFIDESIQRKMEQKKKKELKNQEKGHEKMKFKPECPSKAGAPVKVKSKSKHHINETTKVIKENEDNDECDNECEIIVCPGEQVN